MHACFVRNHPEALSHVVTSWDKVCGWPQGGYTVHIWVSVCSLWACNKFKDDVLLGKYLPLDKVCINIYILEMMSNPIETYGKSVRTEFKLQLCKEYLKQTCLWPTNKLHPWEYCALFTWFTQGGPYQRTVMEFFTDSEATLRDSSTYFTSMTRASPQQVSAVRIAECTQLALVLYVTHTHTHTHNNACTHVHISTVL